MTCYRQLTQEERYQIQAMLGLGICRAEIARQLGRHASTIYREVARNIDPTMTTPYSPRRAAKRLAGLRRRKGEASRKIQGPLQELIEAKLRLAWSPEQVSGRLRREKHIQVSHETIYQHILRDNTGLRYCLRFGGYKHHRFKKSKHAVRTALWRKLLEDRPAEANERKELGHWERDLIVGKISEGAAMLTIVDRRSRYTRLRRVKDKTAATVGGQTSAALRQYGDLNKTITNDNGVEFQKGVEFEQSFGVPIYYTDPGAPWQRGTVENMNGLIRQYIPKGHSVEKCPGWFEAALEDTLNHRPRKTLYYRTPHEVFNEEYYELMNSESQFGLEFSRHL